MAGSPIPAAATMSADAPRGSVADRLEELPEEERLAPLSLELEEASRELLDDRLERLALGHHERRHEPVGPMFPGRALDSPRSPARRGRLPSQESLVADPRISR